MLFRRTMMTFFRLKLSDRCETWCHSRDATARCQSVKEDIAKIERSADSDARQDCTDCVVTTERWAQAWNRQTARDRDPRTLDLTQGLATAVLVDRSGGARADRAGMNRSFLAPRFSQIGRSARTRHG